MPSTVVIGTVLFCSGRRRIVLVWSQTPDPRLIFVCNEDLVDGKPKRSEVLWWLEGSEQTWWMNRERLSLVGGLHSIRVSRSSNSSFILWLWLFFDKLRVWWSDWRSSSLLPPTGCRVELGIEPYSSEWHHISVDACTGGQKFATRWWIWVQRHPLRIWKLWPASSWNSWYRAWGCCLASARLTYQAKHVKTREFKSED